MSTVEAPPTWLVALRDAARARYDDTPRPDHTEEVWRYSRIDDVELDAYAPVDSPRSTAEPVDSGWSALVEVRDGWITSMATPSDLGGAHVGRLAEQADGESAYASVRGDTRDAVGELHDAHLADPVLIDVPRGVHVPGVIVIDHHTDVDGGLTCPHTIIRAAAGSSVTVLERRRSGGASQLVIPQVEIDAAADARIGYLVIQQLGGRTISLEQQSLRAGQQAHTVGATAALGGSYARTRADFELAGRGASGDLLAAYFGDGDQMLDFRTFQEHAAPDTTSRLLYKGAVTGRAQSVYSGLIRVRESAPGTNAFQTNSNLKLSDDAWAYSVPNLEIEQNQVSCSHASTVGEIDDDQRFYLESRGVPTTVAEQLLVSGFFAEVIDQFPVDSAKPELQATIDAALAADRAAREAGHD